MQGLFDALSQKSPALGEAVALLKVVLPLLRQETPGKAAFFARDGVSLEQLRAHRLAPLLYHELARHGGDTALAPALLGELRQDYVQSLQATACEEEEIRELLQALHQAGITFILLKGADLRHRLYAEPALRPMVDLDFMVSPTVVPVLRTLLERRGYRLTEALGHPPVKFIENFGFELTFNPPPGKRLLLEPHWEIRGEGCYYVLPFAPLAAAALATEHEGLPVKVLCPEHLLMHLCIHTHSDLGYAIQLLDVIWTVERLRLNWTFFLQEVTRFRCARPVAAVLEAVDFLTSPKVPASVLSSLRAYSPSWDERALLFLRNGLQNLSRDFPWLLQQRRLWEMVTFVLSHLRSRRLHR